MTKTTKHVGCATVTVTEKLPLFDRPYAHSRDPQTSFNAGEKVHRRGKAKRQRNAVWTALSYFNNPEGLTAKELAAKVANWYKENGVSGILGKDEKEIYHNIQRRVIDLIDAGKVEFLMTNGEWTRYPNNKDLATRDNCRVMRAI